MYSYVWNNPLKFVDPMGFTLQSWDDFWNTVNDLWNNGGGTWTDGGGGDYYGGNMHYYANYGEAMGAGWVAGGGAATGSLGGNSGSSGSPEGPASSWQDAVSRYYKNGGTDPSVATYQEPVVVSGNITNGQWQTSSVSYPWQQQGNDGNINRNLAYEKDSPFKTTGEIVETAGQAFDATKQMTIGAQKLANAITNTNFKIVNGGNLIEGASKGLTVLGATMTAMDGINNGWENHHSADIGIDAAIYIISAEVPVAGWIIGGGYFIGNFIFEQYHNGNSITEYYLDN